MSLISPRLGGGPSRLFEISKRGEKSPRRMCHTCMISMTMRCMTCMYRMTHWAVKIGPKSHLTPTVSYEYV